MRNEEESDWELAQALAESALENSRAYTIEEAPWDLIPEDDAFQRKISAYIAKAMITRNYKLPNVKQMLGGNKRKK